jgi:integrase
MSPPIPLHDLRKFVLALYHATQKSPATVGKIRQMFDELAIALGPDATTAQLTTAGMTSWLALYRPQRAPQTIIGQLSNLRTICAIAAEEGWLDRAPTWKRLWPKVPPPPIDDGGYWSLAEVAALLGYLHGRVTHLGDWKSRRLYAAAAVALYTGLRRDELLFLRLEDVDLAVGIIRVVPRHERQLKTPQSARVVPIAPELAAIVADWTPHAGPGWLFPGIKRRSAWHGGKVGYRPSDELQGACTAAKVPRGTWQWARRTWATHAELAWQLSDPTIERVLGHTPGRIPGATSKRWYRKADLDNLRAIGQRISYQS